MSRVFLTGLEGGSVEVFDAPVNITIRDVGERTGTYCFSLAAAAGSYGQHDLVDPMAEMYIREYIYVWTGSMAAADILQIEDDVGNPHLRFTADGDVDLWTGAAWNNLGNFGGVNADTYNRFEVYVKIHDTAGLITVKLDGATVLTLSGIDTWGGNVGTDPTVGRVCFGNKSGGGIGGSSAIYIDDLAINDTTGSVNNSWPGVGAILAVYPTGVGFYEDFIPTPGTGEQNYEDVDEIPYDTADYVEAAVLADRDTYEMLNVPGVVEVSQVKAVSWLAYVKLAINGDGVIKPLFRFSAYLWDGDDFPDVEIAWDYIMHIEDENPVLGTSWIVDDINSNQFGFQEAS